MSYFPRVPVRFLKSNQELLKSQEEAGGRVWHPTTDYHVSEHTPTQNVQQRQFRAPYDRWHGNTLIRRYPDGSLDMDYVVAMVMSVLNAAKDKKPLTTQEQLLLHCVYPTIFPHEDPSLVESLRTVNLKITPLECMMVAIEVSAHLAEQENFNAGYGGGSVPGRHQTRA